MAQERIPKPGQFYRHFKNKLYQIIALAKHSESGEDMVVYQALYGDYGIYVRPLTMFISEVDKDKYPDLLQRYRFEQVSLLKEGTVETTEKKHTDIARNQQAIVDTAVETVPAIETEVLGVNSVLMEFLDADTYENKLHILIGKKKEITEKLLNDMAMSIDCTLNDGDYEARFDSLIYCLQTLNRFENTRLRK
ncbi:hypothetical protein acsn021_28830 [Anaerocolumna cellulosilytica]|uniref:Uncharacterized protein n=1 Tax=Anaerocolumna cellulosilytica TaxID=433286 RepID=A0A6S6QXE2_9FIRM|nr:DUF1653 domain-containing protein [Anaerocolumna cellulosilytica]MBB5197101.1 hypothetical protein [Anaerocolumna cellulosilytica]BCJ95314.1 hypothetical protein acsn021_28830 [Anaerocolumna cellulosilytica]